MVAFQIAQRQNSDNDSCQMGIHQIVLTDFTTSIGGSRGKIYLQLSEPDTTDDVLKAIG
jgi:hypothetical protein